MNLAIVGCTVVDVIFPEVAKVPRWPRHTEFTSTNLVLLKHGPMVTLGGNGANAAYIAATCGAKVNLYTQIGEDSLGGLAHRWLRAAGCRVQSGRTGSTAINVTAANHKFQRATFFYAGASIALPAVRLEKRPPRVLLVCGWPHPPLAKLTVFFAQYQAAGTFTALDAGPILGAPWSLRELSPTLPHLDLFLCNEYEARRITRTSDLAEAWRRLRKKFAGHLVIKRGSKGAMWLPAGSTTPKNFPRTRVHAVNTVGAGDSFNGALLAALAQGHDFPAALQAASQAAARVVASTRGIIGTQPAKKTRPSAK